MVLDLREEFGYENQEDKIIQPPDYNGFKHPPFVRKKRQRVWFDITYLRYLIDDNSISRSDIT